MGGTTHESKSHLGRDCRGRQKGSVSSGATHLEPIKRAMLVHGGVQTSAIQTLMPWGYTIVKVDGMACAYATNFNAFHMKRYELHRC